MILFLNYHFHYFTIIVFIFFFIYFSINQSTNQSTNQLINQSIRLFITNRYLAFSGWPETRVLIELRNIENLEKKQMFFIPNALTVKDTSGEEYFFGSFLDRDLCFRMLTSMVTISKSLGELTEENDPTISNNHDGDNNNNGSGSNQHRRVSYTRLSNGNIEKLDESNNVIEEISLVETDDNNIIDGSDSESEDLNDDENFDLTKLPDYLKLFNTGSVSSVYDYTTPIASSLIWRICWQEKLHFT